MRRSYCLREGALACVPLAAKEEVGGETFFGTCRTLAQALTRRYRSGKIGHTCAARASLSAMICVLLLQVWQRRYIRPKLNFRSCTAHRAELAQYARLKLVPVAAHHQVAVDVCDG
jgi:hypothetical protein